MAIVTRRPRAPFWTGCAIGLLSFAVCIGMEVVHRGRTDAVSEYSVGSLSDVGHAAPVAVAVVLAVRAGLGLVRPAGGGLRAGWDALALSVGLALGLLGGFFSTVVVWFWIEPPPPPVRADQLATAARDLLAGGLTLGILGLLAEALASRRASGWWRGPVNVLVVVLVQAACAFSLAATAGR